MPLGKSDHVLILMKLSGKRVEVQEKYKFERCRYNKANFAKIRNYFEEVSWDSSDNEKNIQEK